jgi:hypothetical protein
MSQRGPFTVADLNVRGELQLKQSYDYETLEKIPGAADLIAQFSGEVWKTPEEFETRLTLSHSRLAFRWHSTATSAGIATLRSDDELASLSLLACGLDAEADQITLASFQRHLLRELRDTGFEPAFGLMDLQERPLVATINFRSPANETDQILTALADRCFAAAYFRYKSLA